MRGHSMPGRRRNILSPPPDIGCAQGHTLISCFCPGESRGEELGQEGAVAEGAGSNAGCPGSDWWRLQPEALPSVGRREVLVAGSCGTGMETASQDSGGQVLVLDD